MEINPEDCRPFNEMYARRGAPYGQYNLNPAKIVIWDANNPDTPLMGTYTDDAGIEHPYGWDLKGSGPTHAHDFAHDLCMWPLFYCEGNPVHVGSILIDVASGKLVEVTPHHNRRSTRV